MKCEHTDVRLIFPVSRSLLSADGGQSETQTEGRRGAEDEEGAELVFHPH